ncbi:MAG TPA: DUF5668 domain-containing protein [Actinomycetota bacterium]|jgi:EamA domain-containing membrane protein RarD|nr:DUF5668 domain-containing protein [Actinomycetota bacterium]
MNLGALISGLVFIVLGAAFLLERLSVIDISAGFVIPVLLIGVGIGIVLGSRRPKPAEPTVPETREEPAE